MIPTSIDGTDITGATIDGQDVQEITVDGQTVFTSAPTLGSIITNNSTFGGSKTANYYGGVFLETNTDVKGFDVEYKAVSNRTTVGLYDPTGNILVEKTGQSGGTRIRLETNISANTSVFLATDPEGGDVFLAEDESPTYPTTSLDFDVTSGGFWPPTDATPNVNTGNWWEFDFIQALL